ncbi:hypothetical protein [Paenibacillus piscarius]|uniref:hypothetical protein n=1 Tax=Paenibacillus piscarius TaxID=1089681 RepID=UPI001EE786B3|nr:hypothetical protein [Paenibacillus piscarius]
MPEPLPQAAAAAGFTDYVQQYSGPVDALSCLLLEKGARAEQAAAATLRSALWYGLQLPLSDISGILQRSIPELKVRLRSIREQMAAAHSALPAVHRPSAG